MWLKNHSYFSLPIALIGFIELKFFFSQSLNSIKAAIAGSAALFNSAARLASTNFPSSLTVVETCSSMFSSNSIATVAYGPTELPSKLLRPLSKISLVFPKINIASFTSLAVIFNGRSRSNRTPIV